MAVVDAVVVISSFNLLARVLCDNGAFTQHAYPNVTN